MAINGQSRAKWYILVELPQSGRSGLVGMRQCMGVRNGLLSLRSHAGERRRRMRMQWSFGVGMGLCGLALGFGLGAVVGQVRPPTEYQGVEAQVVSTIDLGPDFPGYQL